MQNTLDTAGCSKMLKSPAAHIPQRGIFTSGLLTFLHVCFIFNTMYVGRVSREALYVNAGLLRGQKHLVPPGAGITGSCEPPKEGSGNRTQIFASTVHGVRSPCMCSFMSPFN